MRILLIGLFNYPMYAPAFESGFKALGNDVRSIPEANYLYKGFIGSFLTKVQCRFHVGFRLFEYNHDIISSFDAFQPDFVFIYSALNIWSSTIKALKKKGAFVITYHNDDPFSSLPSMGYYRNFKSLIKYADINYVYRKKNIADYLQKGAKDIRILLPYYIAENNYKEDCKKDIPVAFLGHYEFDGRDRFIKALVDADIPVTVFNGSYWDKSPLYSELKQYIKPGKSGNEYNHTINRCMIALVFFSKRNSDTYTRRCFEIPATCTLMLSQFSEDMNQMYPEDECAVYFRNEVELVEKCNWLLSHPEEIKRIALNGYNRLKELGGSAIDRCKQIIDCYSEIKKRKEISNGE